MLVVGITGASLITMALFQKKGITINEEMMMLAIKLMSFGAILWLMQIVKSMFMF